MWILVILWTTGRPRRTGRPTPRGSCTRRSRRALLKFVFLCEWSPRRRRAVVGIPAPRPRWLTLGATAYEGRGGERSVKQARGGSAARRSSSKQSNGKLVSYMPLATLFLAHFGAPLDVRSACSARVTRLCRRSLITAARHRCQRQAPTPPLIHIHNQGGQPGRTAARRSTNGRRATSKTLQI